MPGRIRCDCLGMLWQNAVGGGTDGELCVDHAPLPRELVRDISPNSARTTAVVCVRATLMVHMAPPS